MKPIHRIVYFAVIFGLLAIGCRLRGEAMAAPYFMIPGASAESATEQLPLKSTAAEVRIAGTIARVKLTQRYANTGTQPIEAVYVFPASTRAAVHGMTLTNGSRVIAARIREAVRAKEEYEAAKSENKTAALLEEQRPNVFQMSVANLLPGDDVLVEIEWSEVIPAVGAVYEYVLPTVVGPRYTGGGSAEAAAAWAANPHLPAGAEDPFEFSLDVSLQTTLPLAECVCPSHPVKVDFQARDRAVLKLDHRHGRQLANRDFILRWKLGNAAVDAGLLLHRGEKVNHFLLQVAPPERVEISQIPGRDYLMVIDISGSMTGFPVDTAKDLLSNLVKGLRNDDTFNIVTFASGSAVFSEQAVAATQENLKRALQFIDSRPAGGGTELEAALRRALALPGGEGRSRSVLLITDGYITAEDSCRELIREKLGEANLFAFGIGSAVNRHLIEQLARAGGGEPVVVTTRAEAGPAAQAFHAVVANPVLAKVRVEAEGVELRGVEPDPHPDVFASRPLVICGTWTGEPRGRIMVRGIGGNGAPFEKVINLAEAAANKGLEHPALPVLWARERVRRLADGPLDADRIGEITALGLEHSLLTAYTSFVAVDETPRELAAVAKTVRQPLPLPQGVSDAAVGGTSGVVQNASVPEPGVIGLLALVAMLFAVQRRRD